ncbi:hypothetical protein [Pseudosulfitobacter pseudonitzschiae]|uniref:hypothetical protein n=1 Tax=Pseudosulfitobacter pseudonitzschiae TaxID=1402135 RepID=UPI001D50F825|nr:hypothetical protein [Pseudosulfitobacter pseudonitzschiae]MBM1921069.1 hypothetical protein [Pseudosulfitobacter pseudonitzschiae]MBM1945239.1 hypothetical protein [Pseudosulfitobacter pseudonitzschiae]MBM1954174.1 hypothetical protein [Pseudosulfitobacter pseudonitzschiae]UFE32516.1 hypothetical protein LOE40_14060 [Pseudosulfitobacter pseudonitzschiae]
MTFTVQGTVTIDGKEAKITLKGIGDEAKKAGAEAEGFSPCLVERYDEPYVDMEPDELGDWVRLSDYQSLAKHIRTPVAEERVRSIKSLEGGLLALDARLSILEAKQ